MGHHSTEVGDELLGDVHPLEELLEESVSKALLDGGDVLLHILRAPASPPRQRHGGEEKG